MTAAQPSLESAVADIAAFLHAHPTLAPAVEAEAARVQGKGFGSETTAHEVAQVLTFVPQPRVVIDVGGNKGSYTSALLAAVPTCEAHVFEPCPSNVEALRSLPAQIIPAALSDFEGTAQLYSDHDGSGLASLTQRDLGYLGIHMNPTQEVPVVRFERYWQEVLSRRIVDVMKIDVEGHEMGVLQGSGQAIEATRLVQFEFGGCHVDTRWFFRDFYTFIERGFRLYRITPSGHLPIDYSVREEDFTIANYLAVNTRFLN